MNTVTIFTVVITMAALCGRVQCRLCSDTYDINDGTAINEQYNSNIICYNAKCNKYIQLFIDTANSTIKELPNLIRSNAFKFNPEESEHLQSSNFKIIMANFTPICQRYTDVMANKYYLQDILFNKNKDTTVTIQLILVIIKLEVMASSLQTAQMESDGSSCVKFTPSQYTSIYHSRLDNPLIIENSNELDATCVLQMRTRNWLRRTLYKNNS